MLGDLKGAEACLDTALTIQAGMDTMGKRYCWTRRAEIALLQGDAARALEITERLIDSAPGLSPGGVITFLWKLKGEALAEMGRMDEAVSFIWAAVENARSQGELFLLWRIHASLGRFYRDIGRLTEAHMAFSAALEVIGELAATIPDGTLKADFSDRAYSIADPG